MCTWDLLKQTITLLWGSKQLLFSSVLHLSASSVYFFEGDCHFPAGNPVILVALPVTVFHPTPMGCVISPGQSWFTMTWTVGIGPRGRYVTQGEPIRAFQWDLTHSHRKKEVHTFWVITSNDDTALGLLVDMSTAVPAWRKPVCPGREGQPWEGK